MSDEDEIYLPISGDVDVDALMDQMGPATFMAMDDPLDDSVLLFTAKLRRMRTPRGRVLVPVEDLIGLVNAQIDAGGTLENVRDWLAHATFQDNEQHGGGL